MTPEQIAEIRRKAAEPDQGRMPTSTGGETLGHLVVWQEVVALCDELQDCRGEMEGAHIPSEQLKQWLEGKTK